MALLADSTAPFMAVMWAGICVALAYQVLTRRWWTAIALVVLGAQTVLNVMTEGDHSKLEHRAVFVANLVAIAYFLIAAAIDDKARKRSRGSRGRGSPVPPPCQNGAETTGIERWPGGEETGPHLESSS